MASSIKNSQEERPKRNLRQYLRVIGPGVITGAAGDDPTGIATYSNAGARSGTGLLWLILIATPMMQVVQVTCSKIGIATGMGLSAVLKEHYGLRVAAFAACLTCIANIGTIGADIAGIAAAFQLLTGVDWQWFVIPITVGVWYLQVFQDYRVVRKALLALSLALFTYIAAGFLARPNWGQVLRDTFIPHVEMNVAFLAAAVGMLGTTISPYLYYFQAAQEVEEGKTVKNLDDSLLDTTAGCIFSNLVAYFIIVATSATLFAHGIHEVDSAERAAAALEPIAGSAAKYLFAAGIIGAGLLAGFYMALTAALAFGLLITLSGVNPMKALFYSQVLTGIVAPVLVYLIFRLAARRDVLGDSVNSWKQQAWGWLTFGVMVTSVALFFWTVLT
jgi:NRAMP (natural resistance-associated macrophage protein)-like metal ion transporter